MECRQWLRSCICRAYPSTLLVLSVQQANKQCKVVFPALLPLTYVPALLERTKALFLALFQPYVTSLIESLSSGGASAGSALKQLKEKIVEERWDEVWDRCFRNCEGVGRTLHNEKSGRRLTVSQEKKSRSTLVKQRVSDGANPAISSADTSDVDVGSQPALSAEEIAKNVQSLKAKMKGGKRRGVRDG